MKAVADIEAELRQFNHHKAADEIVRLRRFSARWKAYAKSFHGWWVRRPSAESLMSEQRLLGVGPSAKGGFEFRMSGSAAVRILADSFLDLLDGVGAPNCIEVELGSINGRGCIVEVRRRGGKTMARLRDDATARAEKAEASLASIDHECDEVGIPAGCVAARVQIMRTILQQHQDDAEARS